MECRKQRFESRFTVEVPRCHILQSEVQRISQQLDETLKSISVVAEGSRRPWRAHRFALDEEIAKKNYENFTQCIETVLKRRIREEKT